MFSRTLRDLAHPREHRVTVDPYTWWEVDEEFEYDEDDEEMDEQEQHEQWKRMRLLKQPEVSKFEPPAAVDISYFDFKGQKFQVIVKLTNIELTPKYKGGVWHVEGTESEAIVATGIYYYSMENITVSLLEFREATSEPSCVRDDYDGVFRIFGMEDKGKLNQKRGNLIARNGRCVVFPNVYQHKVAPFQLVDKTKNVCAAIYNQFDFTCHGSCTRTCQYTNCVRPLFLFVINSRQKRILSESIAVRGAYN